MYNTNDSSGLSGAGILPRALALITIVTSAITLVVLVVVVGIVVIPLQWLFGDDK